MAASVEATYITLYLLNDESDVNSLAVTSVLR